jgi:glycosyltransferase involved in cell wall biosynthesis
LVSELDFGGVETGIVIQSQLIDRERFDFRVCTFWKAGASARKVQELGVPVDVLDTDPFIYSPKATFALARYLRKMRPDVLHASITEADVHASVLAPLRLAKRTIIDEGGFPEIARFRRRVVFSVLNRMVDDIVVVSAGLGEFLAEREAAPRDKLRLIPNCGQPAYFERPKENYEAHPTRFRVAAVGRLVEVKNHASVIQALALLPSSGVELHIFGSGPLKDELLEVSRANGVSDRVFLRGYVSDALRDELAAMDAYVMPSHAEGCSLALIEAMALGLPVLVSRVSGNLEVVGPTGNGWMVDPTDVAGWADAIQRLRSLPADQRLAHGEACRRRAQEHFSPEAYVGRLEQLYLTRTAGAPETSMPFPGGNGIDSSIRPSDAGAG